MPNWCANRMTIKHNDSTNIDLIQQVCEAEIKNHALPVEQREDTIGVLGTLVPIPQNLSDEEQYTFCCEEWGTKWDLCDIQYERVSPNEIYITCETAWGPPSEAFHKLIQQGYDIMNDYCEPGMEFAGIWTNGEDISTEMWPEYVYDDPKEIEEAYNEMEE